MTRHEYSPCLPVDLSNFSSLLIPKTRRQAEAFRGPPRVLEKQRGGAAPHLGPARAAEKEALDTAHQKVRPYIREVLNPHAGHRLHDLRRTCNGSVQRVASG